MAKYRNDVPYLKSNKETDAAVQRQDKGGIKAVLLGAFDTHTMAQNEVGKDYKGSMWRVREGESKYSKDNGFYGHSKVETSYTVVGNNQPRTPNHPQDSFYRNVKNPIGRS